MQEPLYTINEVAIICKVSSYTIERLIKSQKLSATKIGSQWRISEDQLDEYLESRTLKAKKLKSAI